MKNNNNQNIVLSGKTLLVVPSRFPPVTKLQKAIVLGIFYALAVAAIGFGIFLILTSAHKIQPLLVCVGGGVFIAAFGHVFVSGLAKRHSQLIVTENGITIDESNSATWDEIKSWWLCSYKGFERVVLPGISGEGTTIDVDLGDFDFRFKGANRSHVCHLASRGVFFSEEQRILWESICKLKNIVQRRHA